MKKSLAVIALMFSMLLIMTMQVEAEYDKTELIRFHVLANSDSDADQALKCLVKDQVVLYMQDKFAQSGSIEESREILSANMSAIKAVAENALWVEHSDYEVKIEYGYFDFPVKYYGKFSLPAGNYEAVRVIIGEGKGQNWWCVLFPPMCFVDQNQAEDGLHQFSNLEPEKKVVLKWRIGELLQKWFVDEKAAEQTDVAPE